MADAIVSVLPTLKIAKCPSCNYTVVFYESDGDVFLLFDGHYGMKKQGEQRVVFCSCGTLYTIPTP